MGYETDCSVVDAVAGLRPLPPGSFLPFAFRQLLIESQCGKKQYPDQEAMNIVVCRQLGRESATGRLEMPTHDQQFAAI